MSRRRHGLVLVVRVVGPYVLSACSRWTVIVHRTLAFTNPSLEKSSAALDLSNSPYIPEP